MPWEIVYEEKAVEDLTKIDNSQRLQVFKAIRKVSENPLPNFEGGYGKPLGNINTSKLAGYYKIKLLKLGLRVVYSLVREKDIMRIIIVSVRDDETVYKMAEDRIKNKY